MIERGLIARAYDGPRFVYSPVAKPEDASRSALRQLMRTFFSDSPSSAIAALLEATKEPLTVLPVLAGVLPTWTAARVASAREAGFARAVDSQVVRLAAELTAPLFAPIASFDDKDLAGVTRCDCLTQSLAAVACAIYWVHPGVWWVARRLRTERELACDDRVIAAGADPDDCASRLLESRIRFESHGVGAGGDDGSSDVARGKTAGVAGQQAEPKGAGLS